MGGKIFIRRNFLWARGSDHKSGFRCVVTGPELGLCAASGHSYTVETILNKDVHWQVNCFIKAFLNVYKRLETKDRNCICATTIEKAKESLLID